MQKAAIGVSTHSGWAALVAVQLEGGSIEVIEKRRIVLTNTQGFRGSQPFHFVEELEIREAEKYLKSYAAACDSLALAAIRQASERALSAGYAVKRCGLLLASGRPLPSLPQILASHALIHAAEGEFFRDVIRRACSRSRILVYGYRRRELENLAKDCFGPAALKMRKQIELLGGQLGPPWTTDQKAATMAACLALAGSEPDTDV